MHLVLPVLAAALATASAAVLVPRKVCPSPFIIKTKGGFDPPRYWYLANPTGKESNIDIHTTTDDAPVFHLSPEGYLQYHGSPSRPSETFVAKLDVPSEEPPYYGFWTIYPANSPEGAPVCKFVPQAEGPCELECSIDEGRYGEFVSQYMCNYTGPGTTTPITIAEMGPDGPQRYDVDNIPCRKYTLIVERAPETST